MFMPLVDFDPNAPMATDSSLFTAVFLFVLFPFFAYLVMLYIMHGIGLSKLAKRRGIHHPWLAWVPCGQEWLLGCLSDQYQYLAKGKTRYNRRWLLGLSIPMHVLSMVVYVFFVIAFPFILSSDSLLPYLENFASTSQATMLYTSITGLLYLVSIVFVVFRSLALYDLFASSYPRYKIPLLLLSILIDNTTPILIFAVRDNDSGMPPRRAAIPCRPE